MKSNATKSRRTIALGKKQKPKAKAGNDLNKSMKSTNSKPPKARTGIAGNDLGKILK